MSLEQEAYEVYKLRAQNVNVCFTLFMPCFKIQILQSQATKRTSVIVLISQKLFYMFRAMKVHHQEVIYSTETLLYNVMCIVSRMEYRERWKRSCSLRLSLLTTRPLPPLSLLHPACNTH